MDWSSRYVISWKLKLAKIDRIDGLNRKVDFHALRYTFCTMLARQGTSQRMAQELMRHSDPHLTAQIYTDVSQLPTFDAVSALPWQQSSDTHIDTQKNDSASQSVAQVVPTVLDLESSEFPVEEALKHTMSSFDSDSQMAEREGFEPSEPFGSIVFKTTAFGHSAISPNLRQLRRFFLSKCKQFSETNKINFGLNFDTESLRANAHWQCDPHRPNRQSFAPL